MTDIKHDDDLRDQVRELRAGGRSPKQIARALGVRPAIVAPWYAPSPSRTRPCGQSLPLSAAGSAQAGARASPSTGTRTGPTPPATEALRTGALRTEAPLAAPLELARHLVCGAVDYARRLGFEPAPDFQPAAGHLGQWPETSAITFGRHGVPFYISGPYDNPIRVVRTLTRSVGEGNFHYIAQLEAATSW